MDFKLNSSHADKSQEKKFWNASRTAHASCHGSQHKVCAMLGFGELNFHTLVSARPAMRCFVQPSTAQTRNVMRKFFKSKWTKK
jgi:hypothetical protein